MMLWSRTGRIKDLLHMAILPFIFETFQEIGEGTVESPATALRWKRKQAIKEWLSTCEDVAW
jgi:hypothetical protein